MIFVQIKIGISHLLFIIYKYCQGSKGLKSEERELVFIEHFA
jgi:hypothetical protein